jgi:hypothetical protein
MTAEQARQRQAEPVADAKAADGIGGIDGAGREEPAGTGKQGRQHYTVRAEKKQNKSCHKRPLPLPAAVARQYAADLGGDRSGRKPLCALLRDDDDIVSRYHLLMAPEKFPH